MIYATIKVDGRIENIVGGYQRDKSLFYMAKEEGDDFETLYELKDGNAIWNGALRETAQDRYDQTQPGDFFKYRNKKLRRLLPEELKAVDGGSYKFTIGMG